MGGNEEFSELDADELFMTETAEERREWETAIKMREMVLQRSRLEFKQWEDNFTRRRLLAGARMMKLNLALRQRLNTSPHNTLVDNATGNISPYTMTDGTSPLQSTESTNPLTSIDSRSTHFTTEFTSLNNTTHNISQDTFATNTLPDTATTRISPDHQTV